MSISLADRAYMDDQDIEKLLRRYLPAGPSPDLRARIVRSGPVARVWPWAVAAGLLLAASVGLQLMSGRIWGSIIAPAPDAARLAVDDLAEILGGDDGARRYAEAVIRRSMSRTEPGQGSSAFANDGSDAR